MTAQALPTTTATHITNGTRLTSNVAVDGGAIRKANTSRLPTVSNEATIDNASSTSNAKCVSCGRKPISRAWVASNVPTSSARWSTTTPVNVIAVTITSVRRSPLSTALIEPNRKRVRSPAPPPSWADITTTASARNPTNSTPIEASSGNGEAARMSWTPNTIASAASSAPTVVLPPVTNAIAIPGSTPWVSASPRKLSPRSTTHVPITLVQHTLSSAAHSASRRNGLSANGVTHQSTGSTNQFTIPSSSFRHHSSGITVSAQRGRDRLGVGAHHAAVCSRRPVVLERVAVELDDRDPEP